MASVNSNKNVISFLGIIGIGLTTVIGSGIWRDPLDWANAAGILSLVAVTIGWLLFFTAGLSYAECVGMFPRSGGPYSYVGGAINKKWGAFVGLLYYVGYLFIGAILAFLTANFTLNAFGYTEMWAYIVLTVAYVVILGIIAGLTPLRTLGNVAFYWVTLKIVLLLIVAILSIVKGNPENYSTSNLTFSGFQGTIQGSLWALLGFEVMLIFAAEVTKEDGKVTGKKRMPLSILAALIIILIVYLIVALGASSIVGIDGLGNVDKFILVSSTTGIPTSYLYLFAAVSAAGTTYAIFAVLIHQLKVMADGDSLPKSFSREKNGIYYFNIAFSIILVVIISVTMLLIEFNVGTLYTTKTSNIGIIDIFATIGMGSTLLVAMLPAGLIALYLRIKMPILERPFKSPLYYITFPLAILLSTYLIYLNFASLF